MPAARADPLAAGALSWSARADDGRLRHAQEVEGTEELARGAALCALDPRRTRDPGDELARVATLRSEGRESQGVRPLRESTAALPPGIGLVSPR